jgi:hypothetical protein
MYTAKDMNNFHSSSVEDRFHCITQHCTTHEDMCYLYLYINSFILGLFNADVNNQVHTATKCLIILVL